MGNYAFMTDNPIPNVENGHVFVGDNFLQKEPHAKILEGKTGLKFINCNLTNCDIPADAVIEGGLHVHINFCANHSKSWTENGWLDAEVENCPHVIDTDIITIDGVLMDTIYHYSNEVL